MSQESTPYSKAILKLLENGAKAFAEKNYDLSVELYSEACETSNLETGKDDPDLLFLYGKSLFENGVSKSEVLGAAGSSDNKSKPNGDEDDDNDTDKDNDKGMFQFNEKLAEEEDDEDDDEDDEVSAPPSEEEEEEEDNSDDDEKDQDPSDAEEEQTDFEVAWEILDLTRTIYEEKLHDLEEGISKDELSEKPYLKSDKQDLKEMKNPIIITKKKLSDVYDLLGEVSLETENFKQASLDFESLAKLRTELYPFHSGLISEAFYKLSLALEFNTEDITSSAKSIENMKKSLESMKQRFEQPGEKQDDDLLQEMEQRLSDLVKGEAKIKEEKDKIMMGILGGIATTDNKEESSASFVAANHGPAPAAAPVAAVNDLTSMVKKRKPTSSGKMIKKKIKKQ